MKPVFHTLFLLLAVLIEILLLCFLVDGSSSLKENIKCKPTYVRWPRVRLNMKAAKQGALSQTACRTACANDKDPAKGTSKLQCSAFNHRPGVDALTHECQIFQKDSVQHTDGYVEADDRYTFFWKYCVKTEQSCAGDYAFTFLSDRYMVATEVAKTTFMRSLEECLGECLNEDSLLCRSISFNRTDGACHISEQNQVSKPGSMRVNSNPNYRIDYYENNCFNKKGIRIRVNSKTPYTGALYGLYDFFSCRIEPREARTFEYLFPYPSVSNNCSDSIRQSGSDVLLESVLSTDGVEPLYFITSDDLTYQAKCPIPAVTNQPPKYEDRKYKQQYSFYSSHEHEGNDIQEKKDSLPRFGTSVQQILDALEAGEKKAKKVETDEINYKLRGEEKSTTTPMAHSEANGVQTTVFRPNTKDVYPLSPYTSVAATTNPFTTETSSSVEPVKSTASLPSRLTEAPTTMIAIQKRHQDAGNPESPTTIAAIQKLNSNTNIDYLLMNSEAATTMGSVASTTSTVKRSTPGMEAITDFIRYRSEESRERETRATTVPVTAPLSSSTVFPTMSTTVPPQLSSTAAASTNKEAPISSLNSSMSIGTASRSPPPMHNAPTTTQLVDGGDRDQPHKFSFSTHISFPSDSSGIKMRTVPENEQQRLTNTNIDGDASAQRQEKVDQQQQMTRSSQPAKMVAITESTMTTPSPTTIPSTTTTPTPSTTISTTQSTTAPLPSSSTTILSSHQQPSSQKGPTTAADVNSSPPNNAAHQGGSQQRAAGTRRQNEKIIFDIFHNGQPTEAVVVGSRITLSFTPYYAIPRSLYDWEKEPLAIVTDGCQADHVGLVCPPQRTDYGIRVTVEAFRYQTTTQIQYTCMVRVCPFAPCPQNTCPQVEGCPGDLVSRGLGFSRRKRNQELSLEQIRTALAINPQLQHQLGLISAPVQQNPTATQTNPFKMNNSLQQQLIMLGGDTIVRKRLIVVNSEEELRFYVRTGEVPQGSFYHQ